MGSEGESWAFCALLTKGLEPVVLVMISQLPPLGGAEGLTLLGLIKTS